MPPRKVKIEDVPLNRVARIVGRLIRHEAAEKVVVDRTGEVNDEGEALFDITVTFPAEP
ncbi:MAG: hypothetical protein AAFO89_04780 [Planctomycetota bacterium]